MHTAAPRNRATASLRSRHKLKQAERPDFIREHDSTCSYCGRVGTFADGLYRDPDGNDWNVDHVIPVSSSADPALWRRSNLTLACHRCNVFKAQHRLDDLVDVLEQLREHMAGMVAYADRWPRAQA